MNKGYSVTPCCSFHTSPCMHVRHMSCLNLSILGIHCEVKGPSAPTPLGPDTITPFLWGRTDPEHLLLKPHPHPHRTHKHTSEQVMLECTCFPWMIICILLHFMILPQIAHFVSENIPAVFSATFLSLHSV